MAQKGVRVGDGHDVKYGNPANYLARRIARDRSDMKRIIGTALELALVLLVVPGIAEDTFYAFSTMPAAQQFSLIPLSDEQLAAVQGGKS